MGLEIAKEDSVIDCELKRIKICSQMGIVNYKSYVEVNSNSSLYLYVFF